MEKSQNDIPIEQKMMEHGVLIQLPEALKGVVNIIPESMDLTSAMRAPKEDFIFKRLVFNYSFENTSGHENEEYTLIVHVTHADIYLSKISKLAIWKEVDGEEKWVVPDSVEWKNFTSPNPIWAGYFEVTLTIGDPPVALGE